MTRCAALVLRCTAFCLCLCLPMGLALGAETGTEAENEAENEAVTFPQGVAAGDPTHESVVLWTRTDRAAELLLEVFRFDRGEERKVHSTRLVSREATDFTVQARVVNLAPQTVYRYSFRSGDARIGGRFVTAAAPGRASFPSFVFGGDVGGQGYCRHAGTRGYAFYRQMRLLEPDFFVANGDMIYADSICPAEGPPFDGEPWPNVPGDFPNVADVDWQTPVARETIDAHWRYNRADPYATMFYAQVPYYAQWDDHEVINDFGGPWESWPHRPDKPGFPELVAAGKDAFLQWNPIDSPEPGQIYRSVRRGRHLEIFFLDGRSYRSPNLQPDGPDKTILGEEQVRWLIDAVTGSDATWKVISSNVPISMVTGWPESFGRDAFADGLGDEAESPSGADQTTEADDTGDPDETSDTKIDPSRTGAEHELLHILRAFDAADVKNLLVLATDVHFASQVRFDVDLDGDGDRLRFHEVVCGPFNAVAVAPKEPDPTLEPEVIWSRGEIFNFAHLRLRQDGEHTALDVDILGVDGRVLPGSRLRLVESP